MQNEQQVIKNRKVLIIILFVAIFMITIAVWLTTTLSSTPEGEGKISNISSTDLDISDQLKTIIQKRLYETIDLAYGIKDGKTPVANIRKESIKSSKRNDGSIAYSFLVDVDNYELTYRAEVWDKNDVKASQAYFYCVEPNVSKYPKHFCIGYNGQSTISVTIGDNLPLSARETKNHYLYDAKVAYRKDSITPYISIFTMACGGEKVTNEIRDDFRKWISDQGYDPDLYTIEIPNNCSHSGE